MALYRSFLCAFRDTEDFTEEQVKHLEDVFQQSLPPNKQVLTLTEFKKIIPSKNVRALQVGKLLNVTR